MAKSVDQEESSAVACLPRNISIKARRSHKQRGLEGPGRI